MSETRRSLIRITSNYARLLSTLVLGLFWAPLMLRGVQDDAFGLIAFLGTNAGLADRIRGVINRSMVRELGAAYHSDDPQDFLKAFNCALVVCMGVGVLTLLLHGALIAVLPLFPVSQGLLVAGCWFIVAKGIESFFTVVLAPIFSFYLIDERMPTYNFWLVAIRSANVLAAIFVVVFFPLTDASTAENITKNVLVYGFLSAGIATLMLGIAVSRLVLSQSQFRPNTSLVSRSGIKDIVTVGGWNTTMVIATGTFLPATGMFMYGTLGSLGGRIFGIAMPLTFYVRMLATGMAAGLDAVSTRVSAGKSTVSLKQIMFQAARLNGFVIFPAMLFIVVLAEPIIQVWVGNQLKDPGDVALAADLIRGLAFGATAMGISDAWVTIMYGAGYIKRIAPMILIGLFACCAITPVALWMSPSQWDYLVPAICCSIALGATMLLGIAIVVSRAIESPLAKVFAPLARPFVVSLVPLPLLFVVLLAVGEWSLPLLIGVLVVYGLAYLALSWRYILQDSERDRVRKALRSFRSGKQPQDSRENSSANLQ